MGPKAFLVTIVPAGIEIIQIVSYLDRIDNNLDTGAYMCESFALNLLTTHSTFSMKPFKTKCVSSNYFSHFAHCPMQTKFQ